MRRVKIRTSRSSGNFAGPVGNPVRETRYPATTLTREEQGILASASLDKEQLPIPQVFIFAGTGLVLGDAVEPMVLDKAYVLGEVATSEILTPGILKYGHCQTPIELGLILKWPMGVLPSPEYALASSHVIENATNNTLLRVAQTATQEYEDETAPTPDVIEELSGLINEASKLMATAMTEGVVSTFYGEINVTWRNANGNGIVRLACFPNRPSILQFGSLSQPLGSYQSQQSPSALDLAGKLDALGG